MRGFTYLCLLLLCTLTAAQTDLSPGTRLRVELQTEVDTRTSRLGDVVEAQLVEPVQEGGSILFPVGTRLTGRVVAISSENKHEQKHALLQLSFDELILPDGRTLKTQATMQSLGTQIKVDADGIAAIHPLSHDFIIKTGRKLWLRVNSSKPAVTTAVASNNPPSPTVENSPIPASAAKSKTSSRMGDLLITLNGIEDPAVRSQYATGADRHEVLIRGTIRNLGKNPVCAFIHADLETSFKLDEPVATTLAKQNSGLIRELLPAEQLDGEFTASVKNGTTPLKLKISQSEPEQGCGDNSHTVFRTDVSIPVADLPKVTGDLTEKTSGEIFKVGNGVSPPRVIHHVEPEFSKEARKHHHQGTVVVRATVGTDGRIHDPHVTRSLGWGLDEKAIEAVSQWLFDPAVKDGQKVAVYVDIEVNFRLSK